MAVPWLNSTGFCFTFGTPFAKIRRVYLVFHKETGMRNTSRKTARSSFETNYKSSQKDAVAISFQETLLSIGAVTLIDATVLVAWTVADSLDWTRVVVLVNKNEQPLESQGYCTSDYWSVLLSS